LIKRRGQRKNERIVGCCIKNLFKVEKAEKVGLGKDTVKF